MDYRIGNYGGLAERAVLIGAGVAFGKAGKTAIKLARKTKMAGKVFKVVKRMGKRETKPFVPDEYWTRNAPKQGTPNTKIKHKKYNSNTGQIEDSTVIYDKAGRQQYRVDKSDH